MKESKPIIVELYNDKLNYFEIFLASLFYTISLFVLLSYFYFLFESDFDYKMFKVSPSFLTAAFIFLNPAIKISEVNIIKANIAENKIYHSIKIFFYQKNKVIEAESFEYVAINKSTFGYKITLWYEGNRRMELVAFYNKEKAYKYAKAVAKGLNTDLLDKTDVNNPVWTACQDL